MQYAKMKNHRHLPAFVLLHLTKQENHGSAICKELMQEMPDFQCDTAAIYRTLNQLEADGAVSYRWDTTKRGAARKIYHITDIGYKDLLLWKSDVESRIKKLTYFLNEYERMRALNPKFH